MPATSARNHVCGLGLGLPRFDRRGGALRGHGSLWEIRDPDQLVRVRRARACSGFLGQGALVLADPASAENPFFLLFPSWLLAPAILLTTAATVIASQAVLSGAFALVQQAIQLRGHSAARGASDFRRVGWPSLCATGQLAAGGARSYDFPAEDWKHLRTSDEIDKQFLRQRAIYGERERPRGEARRVGCKRRQASYSFLAGLRRSRAWPFGGRGRQASMKCS
jgi:hypothetical protein